jgi:hypothetical protein
MTFRPELIDELLKEYRHPEDLMGEGGIAPIPNPHPSALTEVDDHKRSPNPTLPLRTPDPTVFLNQLRVRDRP